MIETVGVGFVVLLVAGAVLAARLQSRDRAQLSGVWQALEAAREADPPRFDPTMVDGLPEVARRYFARAIAPGTPLHRVVRLEMEGSFVLNGKALPMRAREILAPPAAGFVWQAEMGSGWMRLAGSDGYYATGSGPRESWTKFWLHGLIPVARIGTSDDHARAAATRAMLEAVWVPASLLPQFGARWTQTGPDRAEVQFDAAPGIEPMQLTLDADGNVIEVVTLRWSDANPERLYRSQPFGGSMVEWGSFDGFTIPTRIELGNLFGMPDYAPFFFATVVAARFR